jgi:hypothetical protein
MDAVALHFFKQTRAKVTPITQQAMQVGATGCQITWNEF